MNNDLISRSALIDIFSNTVFFDEDSKCKALELINNAPTVEPRIEYGTDGQPYRLFMSSGQVVPDMLQGWRYEERPQDKFVEVLNDRIEERVCKYCQMNKHCELCEISRVFSIIYLTDKEMKGGADNENKA